jgi:hypothetical protein
MDGSNLPNVVEVLRGAGLDVQEWSGWQRNSRSSGGYDNPGPICTVVHHTASPSTSSFQNDWSYCVVGNPDNPVANMLLGRQGQWGVHAGGASNHAGKGGPWNTSRGQVPLDSANSRSIGIEAQNNGVGELWSSEMVESYIIGVSAMCRAYGQDPLRDVMAHFEWAPGRKIDPWGGNQGTAGFPFTGPRQWIMGGGGGFRDYVAVGSPQPVDDPDLWTNVYHQTFA